MFENTKLSPVYNGYQYLFVFICAMVVDLIVHFFSLRKLNALKSGGDAFGFAPELAVYYSSLGRKGPFPINYGNFYTSCNSWLLGMFIAGTLSIFILLMSDLFLQAVDYKNSSSSQ